MTAVLAAYLNATFSAGRGHIPALAASLSADQHELQRRIDGPLPHGG